MEAFMSRAMSLREQRAYYPAGILLVDHREIVELFAASGALIQSRIAVVDVSGHPRDVVRWLTVGARAGHRAPVGYLHDAATVLYPFAFEPLRTLVEHGEILFRDLGFRPGRGFRDPPKRKRVFSLADADPTALVTYAVRGVLEMLEGDAMLAPRRQASVGSPGGGIKLDRLRAGSRAVSPFKSRAALNKIGPTS
jgi:hypothetical protein